MAKRRRLSKEEREQRKALREKEIRERALDKHYTPSGKWVLPESERKRKRKVEIANDYVDRAERYKKKPWRYRRNAKKDAAKVRAARKALDKGSKPRATEQRIIGGARGKLTRTVYHYVGLAQQKLVEDLIESYYDDKSARVTVKVGTGYGKGSKWIASKTVDAHRARMWLYGWENLPSAQEVLQHAEEGGAVWWEIEVLTWE